MSISNSDLECIRNFQKDLINVNLDPHQAPLPTQKGVVAARNTLVTELPEHGLGIQESISRLDALKQGFNNANQSSLYFGFVTGGINPAATAAEALVSAADQNCAVSLPAETVANRVEYETLRMLCQLFDLQPDEFQHRIFTTGATASNVLGLACGRESVLRARNAAVSTGKMGLLQAMRMAEVDTIQILTTIPHSSLAKAASIVGLGRDAVRSVSQGPTSVEFDWEKLVDFLKVPRTASIVAVSCAEVNTGFFTSDIKRLRALCDEYQAYVHVDAAFGLSARCLRYQNGPPLESDMKLQNLSYIMKSCDGIELADSITGDGHKLLNVPYDCGFFFSKRLDLATDVFQNAGAAYLSSSASDVVPSPLNIGIENSRRFRALPVYASLITYGRAGYAQMILKQIQLARELAQCIDALDFLQLLPSDTHQQGCDSSAIYVIVLFRAMDDRFNDELVQRIKDTRKMYVSGTSWEGAPATRIAVSNWQASASRDAPVVEAVLREVFQKWRSEQNS